MQKNEEKKNLQDKCETELRELDHHYNKEYSNENARADQLKHDHQKDEIRAKNRKAELSENNEFAKKVKKSFIKYIFYRVFVTQNCNVIQYNTIQCSVV